MSQDAGDVSWRELLPEEDTRTDEIAVDANVLGGARLDEGFGVKVSAASTTPLVSVPRGLITSIGTGGGGGETMGGIYIDNLNANKGS